MIFAAGLSIGVARNDAPGQPAPLEAGVAPSASGADGGSVSREELAQLEQRLRAEMSQMRTASPSRPRRRRRRRARRRVMQQVKALIEQSEERQRRDFTLRMVDLASNFETQRRVDLASVRESVGQQQGAIGTEFASSAKRSNEQLVN